MISNNLVCFDYEMNPDTSLPIKERYQVKFRPVTRELKPWIEEFKLTALKIASSTDKPIYLSISGGIDGESVARIFLENNIPFKAFTLRYTDNSNEHDIVYAIDFCKTFNIEHIIHDVDYDWLYGVKKEQFIDQGYYAINLYRYLQLYILECVDALGGMAILAAGEQVYYSDRKQIYLGISPELLLSFDYCQRNNTTHYVNFFLNNSEIYASYMKIPIIEKILARPDLCTNDVFYSRGSPHGLHPEKPIIYSSIWPDMTVRPKYSGWEKKVPNRTRLQTDLVNRFPWIKSNYIPIDIIKQQLNVQ